MSGKLVQPVAEVLAEILKEVEVPHYVIEPAPTNIYPLFLFLTLNFDKVGFAVLDGKPQEDYLRVFEKFRESYSIHCSEWAEFDLTLVLCVENRDLITDEFLIEKEHDPYFCRKFVIDLKKDLKSQLSYLPFIPLSPAAIGIKRPISAQTFLMERGVKSELARYIVVPHARGIERIVEDCLKEDLGGPVWREVEKEKFAEEVVGIKPKVRLRQLEINNFRAYRDNHKFDLDADLIVLYGPNGLGKTSLFDAIDFACTGGVARLDARFGQNVRRLTNVLRHLDASIEDSFVGLTTSGDNGISVERYLKDPKKASIDGSFKNRTPTLMMLSGISEELMDLRVENFVRLFRSTHLFGQEFQSLTSELQHYSRLPEDVVSRMLAFQDYVEAINKAGRVSEELKRRSVDKRKEINTFKEKSEELKSEIRQLKQTAKVLEKPETLELHGKKLAKKISRERGISIRIPEKFDQEVVREWRAQLGIRRVNIINRLEKIEKVEEKLSEFLSRKKELAEKENEVVKKKELIERLTKTYSDKKRRLEIAEEELKQMITEEDELSLKRENLIWLFKVRSEHEKLMAEVESEDVSQKNIQKKLAEALPKNEKTRIEKESLDKSAVRLDSEIKTLEKGLNEIVDFEERASSWAKELSFQEELKQLLVKVEQQLVNEKKSLEIKRDELDTAIDVRKKLRNQLDELQQSQSELMTLLDSIEKHITTRVCPVCGTSHESRDILVEKLKLQRGMKPKQLQEALKAYKNAEVRVCESNKEVEDLEAKIKKSQKEIERIQRELEVVKGRRNSIKDQAISLEIPLTAEDLTVVTNFRKQDLLKQIKSKRQELADKRARALKQQERLEAFLKQKEKLEQELRISESTQKQSRSKIEQIRAEASDKKLSLTAKKEAIQRDLKEAESTLDSLINQIKTKQSEFQALREEYKELTKEINIQKKQLQELDMQIAEIKTFINEIGSLIKQINLDSDFKKEQLVARKELLNEELTRLDALLEEVTNFEVSLDEAQKSAALSRLEHEENKTKKHILISEKGSEELNKWFLYFQEIRQKLQSVRNNALKVYIERYGPLASDIQKRLRAVYSFGEISLHPEKGEIVVEVERGAKKRLTPSDYFSASQMNIVALSIFLGAALTQTWSSFAPVLLDDPVTHFDDLNAYSLIDCIRGLIMTEKPGNGRQFIISTCEERLYRLMREKFSRLNGRAIYYIFESIGEKGPKIKQE